MDDYEGSSGDADAKAFDGLYGTATRNAQPAPNVLQTGDFGLMFNRYMLLRDRIERFFAEKRREG